MDAGSHSPEKEIEDVKLLVESLEYQKDDSSQQQQALKVLAEILSKNSESNVCFWKEFQIVMLYSLYSLQRSASPRVICSSHVKNKFFKMVDTLSFKNDKKRLGRAKVIVVNIIFYISIYRKEFMIFIPIKEDFAEKLKIKKLGEKSS